ncbi:sensor histidine kinase [Pedosphaera parvula]|uniref:Integral membrane sensor signal transduction histidine kinase n=1 Tax=Pedosphaera parvula (strain Ellin514) TaxID=320771 RepID=B9XAK7_PEDPL|nr:ATP-binding protein [Pedosphaera parvula]EEF63042.1 integral membrane sensor signal transduction histidine kinase [Pedosphaera parvula Ellin514]
MSKKSAVSFLRKPERQRWRQSIAAAFCFGALLFVVIAQTPAEELHTVAAIRGLTMEQTRQKIPVRLHGVVTFFDENLYSRFIQDETVGIYLQFPLNVAPPMLVPGQLVEVTGVASPGEYAPVVLVDTVRVTGKSPLPVAKPVTYEQLASGKEDSQFVETAGIVRSVRKLEASPYHQIEIVTGGGRLLIFANELPVEHPEELLDSTVRVRGVCSTLFNHQRQLFAIRLMVPGPDDLTIIIPATKDPFAIPARPIGSLLQFTPQVTYGHRVKVVGTVNYFEPGTVIFLQDGEHGVEVQTKEPGPLQLGDRVEVLGYVNQGDYTPLLQDAVYRTLSTSKPPTPSQLTHDEALKGEHDCQLVQIVARLIDRTQHGSEQFLILQEGNFIFQASLKQNGGHDNFALLENDSRVAVTGVCRIERGEWQAGENWRAKSFSIRLRSPDDVVLLESPPWWTLRRVLWIATALGFVTLAAFSWVAVLRRRVTERTRELEVQIQKRQAAERRREIEQERARVAHDLHDDLGSGLTEVNMLTTLVKSSTTSADEKERYLGDLSETARRMVNSLDEIVWAVNPRNDTIASLASYFGSYAQRFLDLASVACGLDIAEDLPEHPLDPKFRQELFFAFKEALTNVVRHAGATQVWLRISVRADNLLVEVSDNGLGFDLRERQAGSDGLTNMNERMKSLGGQCEIKTTPQKGTSIQFRAPLPGKLL